MWDLIVSVPDHCLSFYFKLQVRLLVCTEQKLTFNIHFIHKAYSLRFEKTATTLDFFLSDIQPENSVKDNKATRHKD